VLGSTLTYLQRHVIGFAALVFALGGSAYAVANTSSSRAIRICVQSGTGVLRAAGPSGHCPRGEQSFLAGGSGARGPRGFRGRTGPRGAQGVPGKTGNTGPKGDQGQPGPIGPSRYAEFYALMPTDNAATVAVGSAVQFPENGPQKGGIVRSGASSPSAFVLPNIGTYRVAFSVSVTEAGQLELTLDAGAGASPLPYTVYGRATGTSQIVGEALVTTTVTNSVISLINPTGNANALTITPSAGGTHPVAASVTIEQLS
jgi:hypothetical protein